MKKTPSLMTLVFLLLTVSLSRAEEHVYLRTALPPLMEFLDGRRVKTPTQWVERRAEIRKLLIKHFIGEFPDTTPRVIDATIVSDDQHQDGSRRRRIQITLETPSRASLEMTLWTPAGEGPFPLLLCAPRYYQLPWAEDALTRGYAVCLFPGIDSHHKEQNFPGYESVWETFRREFPDATWTEISTKGWLASRCLDYLLSVESAVRIQPEQVAMIGFSRYGKMAMIAAAFDERITCIVARSPGSPGSCPYRLTSRNTFAETPADFPGQWFLPSLRKFYGREDELPIDAHGWYALIAPRPCLIHTAHNDGAEPTFAVEKAWLEGRKVYQFLEADQNLRVDYRPGGHSSIGPDKISAADRKRNLDWIDLSFGRGSATHDDFPEVFLHNFNWDHWREQQDGDKLAFDEDAPVAERLKWVLGEEPESVDEPDSPEFLTPEESALMTHDRWKPGDIRRVPIRFGDGVRGNLYFNTGLNKPVPVVVWLHPLSYHSGYNEGYGVQGTTVYNRLAQQGYAVIAYDQCGFGLRLLEGTTFYERFPHWSRLGRMVRDARAAVSFAVEGKGTAQSEIPELDPDRVFLLGYSVGALTAMYAGALDERVAGTACFSGWTPVRQGNNRRLWLDHALLPRLGLFADRPEEIPIDYDELLPLLARKPCLIVTPRRDRFVDNESVTKVIRTLAQQHNTLMWVVPDTSNRFQAEHHEIFLDWCKSLIRPQQ
jgi:dienelactone hydrolase